jgi:hypothetical protein
LFESERPEAFPGRHGARGVDVDLDITVGLVGIGKVPVDAVQQRLGGAFFRPAARSSCAPRIAGSMEDIICSR